MKKLGGENTPNNEPTVAGNPPQPEQFDYNKEQAKLEEALGMDASIIDSAELANADKPTIIEPIEDSGPAFPGIVDDEPDPGMTLHSKEFYEKQTGFAPAIEVADKKGNFPKTETKEDFKKRTEETRQKQFRDQSEKIQYFKQQMAKPATERDLSNIDESVILDLPQIQAASFEVIDMLNLKPKDKNIRFKWANYKNAVAGNLGRYMALGFQTASVDDVDIEKTPVDASMIEGTQVKYYDVILLKVPVMRLMSLLKANMLRSISRMQQTTQKGLKEANRQFKADIESTGQQSAYNHYREVLEKEPVEFYIAEN